MKYLYPRQVLFIHEEILKATGGLPGLRSQALLESAVFRPMATFGGQELYPDIFLKAAVLLHSLIQNHPFGDANKRTGYLATRLFLKLNGYSIHATLKEKINLALTVAKGAMNETEIASWLSKKARPTRL